MIPLVPLGTSTALSILYVFIPITGRIGLEAPVDVIIPIVCVLSLLIAQFYILLPASYRIDHQSRTRLVHYLAASCFCFLIIFSNMNPYTPQQPKRVYCAFMENTTSGERGLHLSFADRGMKTEPILALEKELLVTPVKRSEEQTMRDWSTLHPFSQFVENYYFKLPEYKSPLAAFAPKLTATSLKHDNGSRSIHLECNYEHFIWTVISFKANVSSWSFSVPPPNVKSHTIRHGKGTIL